VKRAAGSWSEFLAGWVVMELLEYALGALWVVASLVATFVLGFDGFWSTLVCAFVAIGADLILRSYFPGPPGSDGIWTKPIRPEMQRRNKVTAAFLTATVLAIIAAFVYTFFLKK
jgi:uncharacterized membrane protein YvlD (DUF360 family)